MKFFLKEYLSEKQRIINDKLNFIMDGLSNSTRIHQAMTYSLMAGGKRIRPILCIAAAEIIKDEYQEEVLQIACAIEMIHTYSLIHDDLPSMDNDDLRRGQPTLHVKFDEATAILTGDALLTLAFQIISSSYRGFFYTGDHKSEKIIKATQLIVEAAGYEKMIEGQMQDILSTGEKLTLQEIEILHSLKTGALITASVCAGAIIGEANLKQIESLKIYAEKIGLAFQVTDDILNVTGDPKAMGKAASTDKKNKKNTFPSIIGLEESQKYAEKLIDQAVDSLNNFDYERSMPLRAIAQYIITRNK